MQPDYIDLTYNISRLYASRQRQSYQSNYMKLMFGYSYVCFFYINLNDASFKSKLMKYV